MILWVVRDTVPSGDPMEPGVFVYYDFSADKGKEWTKFIEYATAFTGRWMKKISLPDGFDPEWVRLPEL